MHKTEAIVLCTQSLFDETLVCTLKTLQNWSGFPLHAEDSLRSNEKNKFWSALLYSVLWRKTYWEEFPFFKIDQNIFQRSKRLQTSYIFFFGGGTVRIVSHKVGNQTIKESSSDMSKLKQTCTRDFYSKKTLNVGFFCCYDIKRQSKQKPVQTSIGLLISITKEQLKKLRQSKKSFQDKTSILELQTQTIWSLTGSGSLHFAQLCNQVIRRKKQLVEILHFSLESTVVRSKHTSNVGTRLHRQVSSAAKAIFPNIFG